MNFLMKPTFQPKQQRNVNNDTDDTTMATVDEVLPPEASSLIESSNLEVATVETLTGSFGEFFRRAEEWNAKAKAIVITDVSQTHEMKIAREARLALREIRLASEKVRKQLKEDSLRKGKAIDGMHNILKAIVEPLEQHLKEQEDYVELQQAKEKALREQERSQIIAPYLDMLGGPLSFSLGDMTEEQWESYIAGVKARHEQIEQEKAKAEAERIERERKEAEERAKIEAENAKLREEAEKREKQIAKEKAEAEAKAKAEREKIEAERKKEADEAAAKQAEIEAKAKAEREKIEAERKKEADARRKLEQEKAEKEQAEAKAKADAEEAERKKASAPDREKIEGFADLVAQMRVPEVSTEPAAIIRAEVESKVQGFSKWIHQQASKL